MRTTLIYASSSNGVIGNKGRLPWHIPEELKHFKETTMGHWLIVGHNTYSTLPELPGRNIAVIRRKGITVKKADQVLVYESYTEAIEALKKHGVKEVFIAGGAATYKQAMEHGVDRVLHSHIWKICDGDCSFTPDLSEYRLKRTKSYGDLPECKGLPVFVVNEYVKKEVKTAISFEMTFGSDNENISEVFLDVVKAIDELKSRFNTVDIKPLGATASLVKD